LSRSCIGPPVLKNGIAFSGTDTVALLRGLPASARPPELDRKYTEPTQFHAVTARQRGGAAAISGRCLP